MENSLKLYIISDPLAIQADVLLGSGPVGARYLFFIEQNGAIQKAGDITLNDEIATITNFANDTQSRLKKMVEEALTGPGSGLSVFLPTLRDLGTRFASLIPPDVLRIVKNLPKNPVPTLFIYSRDHWIPWELIYSGKEFWGDKCIVARVPILDYDPDRVSESIEPDAEMPLDQVVNIIGDQVLENLEDADIPVLRLDALRQAAGQNSCNLDGGGTFTALGQVDVGAQLENASIAHFTCHGSYDLERGFYLQLLDSPEESKFRFYNWIIKQYPISPKALVFVNACSSDAVALHQGSFINLGQEFYENGARCFIGTLAPVPIVGAVQLAGDFYTRLLAGVPVGQALFEARMAVKNQGNPFWLLYCLYGDAWMRFKKS